MAIGGSARGCALDTIQILCASRGERRCRLSCTSLAASSTQMDTLLGPQHAQNLIEITAVLGPDGLD